MGKKQKKDRIIVVPSKSPLVSEIYPDWADEEELETELEISSGSEEEAMVISGELGLGNNPMTITLTDEVTGMEMELTHVKNALLVIEDQRKSSSGWLSLVIGDIEKVGDVLKFVAKATVKELKRMVKRH
jgi:hypothetical protein